MADELERADVVLVPLRFGSGTRLKIIEAFAHRIPVVSTTLGAEGLDAEDGHHLLLADTPAALARACARLLSDDALRARLVANAHALFEARFTSAGVEEIIAGIAVEAGGGPGAVDRP
jgi:glycosyltransferase involved in cell wall biosynthesis